MAAVTAKQGLTFFLCLFYSSHSSVSAPVHVTFVAIGSYRYITTVPAIEAAVASIEETYKDTFTVNLELIFKPSIFPCEVFVDNIVNLASRFYYNTSRPRVNLEAFVGPSCASELIAFAPIAREWNVPYLSFIGTDNAVSNKKLYPTTLTVSPIHHVVLGEFFQKLLKLFHWTTLFMLCDDNAVVAFYRNICRNFKTKQYIPAPVRVNSLTFNSDGRTPVDYDLLLNYASISARGILFAKQLSKLKFSTVSVILILSDALITRNFMVRAFEKNMTSGDYVYFFAFPYSASDYLDLRWQLNDSNDKAAFQAFKQLFLVTFDNDDNANRLTDKVKRFIKRRSKQAYNYTYGPNEKITAPVVAGYESCWLLAQVINESVANGYDFNDTDAGPLMDNSVGFIRRILNRTFELPTGPVYINENGDRYPNMLVKQLSPSGNYQSVLEYVSATRIIRNFSNPYILWIDGYPPSNEPYCGYQGKKAICLNSDSTSSTFLLPIVVVVCLSLFFGICLFLCGRRRFKQEVALHDQWWSIDPNMINGGLDITISRLQLSTTATATIKTNRANTCNYEGDVVWKKAVQLTKPFSPDKHLLILLGKLRNFDHNSINNFRGIVVDTLSITFITTYCPKNSLDDIYNDMVVDWDFKVSLCKNLLEGLEYIQDSFLHFHGNLTSSKCLIDNRFELRINGAGQKHISKQFTKPTVEQADESLFWTAPELLRNRNTPYSMKSEIFSLGIILQQIILWSDPYVGGSDDGIYSPVSPTEIIGRVRIAEIPAFRPVISSGACKAALRSLVELCWAENPTQRPNISAVVNRFSKIEGTSNQHLLDKMLKRMQKYADDLESMVDARTADLLDETKKCDDLLKEMLPSIIVKRLRDGNVVEAEMFESVTIYFSDIVGFMDFVTISSPLEVVNFLSRTYANCDDVLTSYDVYKVETIADSYMVASGLPIRNGNAHAYEIASMALQLLNVFTTKCGTESLRLRIGINSGPCAACVVGIKAPRYCLFGDTINTASRMESNGEALRIHVSPATAEYLLHLPVFLLEKRGLTTIKGKGEMMTFWLVSGPIKFTLVEKSKTTF